MYMASPGAWGLTSDLHSRQLTHD